MEKHLYTCQFCQIEFKPGRRKIQKFCSDTCRSKNHYHKNNSKKLKSLHQLREEYELKKEQEKTKIEQMSLPGIGNAATGVAIVQLLTKLLTKLENKPATKKDIQEIKDLMNMRYFEVHNISTNPFGKKAFFDMSSSKIVYYDELLKRFELPQFDL